ncbi:LOW QUALITY PROTEIN: olfactory receptor 5K1-like [Ornithorhynchus anatinus]|uniref:LOW QUALITY PROTEIN: olfactory receptor 5K1-like n=1 Tax=Ornithorhynchus anatinus TaxID=9258 RepID=UPI0007AA7FCB|nr:LOW QUALITY PROTEIN: olfactory receptor 5K1-like [Ornithorhynchus anatinus]
MEFVLSGFTDKSRLQLFLFVVLLVTYMITIVGNLGLVMLIWVEPRLHTPMYFFLGNLGLTDACCSCSIIPKVLMNIVTGNKAISLSECMVLFYFLCFAETADCFLLAAMAYDRYIVIFNPLLYPVMMSKKLCIHIHSIVFIAGNLHSIIHVGFLFRLTFCRSNIISHFYCDALPLYRLSCTDPYINVLMIFIFSGSIQVFTITTVLVSYHRILFTILTFKSKEGRGRAFSICASHFLSVSLLYGSILFMYVWPGSIKEENKDILVAVFYTIIIPLLNPFIYSIRNKELISVFRKIMKRRIFFQEIA